MRVQNSFKLSGDKIKEIGKKMHLGGRKWERAERWREGCRGGGVEDNRHEVGIGCLAEKLFGDTKS